MGREESQLDGKLVKWQVVFVKTTLDLPDDLVRRMKIRAVYERRPLKRLVADLLSQALETWVSTRCAPPPLPDGVELNERGYPVFCCAPGAPASRMTAEELIALEQKILESEDMQRAGLPD